MNGGLAQSKSCRWSRQAFRPVASMKKDAEDLSNQPDVASNEKDAPGSGQHLTQSIKGLNSCRPVKQRRALLESNPPRVSWIERRRNKKRLRIWGGQNLPKCKQRRPFISEPEHASKNSSFLFDEVAIILK